MSVPEVLPALYLWEEGVSRAAGVVHDLPVSVDAEVGHQSSSGYCTAGQTVAEQVHGMPRRQSGSVVPDDGHAISQAVVAPGVWAEVVPASAFIDVAVRADHKAENMNTFVHKLNLFIKKGFWDTSEWYQWK